MTRVFLLQNRGLIPPARQEAAGIVVAEFDFHAHVIAFVVRVQNFADAVEFGQEFALALRDLNLEGQAVALEVVVDGPAQVVEAVARFSGDPHRVWIGRCEVFASDRVVQQVAFVEHHHGRQGRHVEFAEHVDDRGDVFFTGRMAGIDEVDQQVRADSLFKRAAK